MADQSAIEWCDSTFNPWIGCTKVSPACDHCYAETLMDTRMGRAEWGAGKPRVRTSTANWRKPVQWNSTPFVMCPVCGYRGSTNRQNNSGQDLCPQCFALAFRTRRRVFCASLADVFDNEIDPQWRRDLFDLISATPNLDWLLLTKRIGNVRKVYGGAYLDSARPLPRNVRIGITICNQPEADRDLPKLLALGCPNFVSIEPMLGPIDLRAINDESWPGWTLDAVTPHGTIAVNFETGESRRRKGASIDWVIAGGESGPHARPSNPDWFRSLRDQCAAAGVPFLFKQWGEWLPPQQKIAGDLPVMTKAERDKHTFVIAHNVPFWRIGKKLAGRLLDGREHNGFPVVSP